MDPFLILDVEVSAGKAEILAQVARTLRTRRYDAKTVAEAQKQLFDPLTRAVAEFRYRIDLSPCAGPIPEPDTADGPLLTRLHLDEQ